MSNEPISPKPRKGIRVWVDCVLLYLIVLLFGLVGICSGLVGALLNLVLPKNHKK